MTTSGDVAVVTGAGSGLGRHIARALLADGYRVVLAGRRADALHETATTAEKASDDSVLVVPTDVADPDSVAALFDSVHRAYGRVDLLVNNAGTFGPSGAVDEISPAEWQRTADTNLTGAFLCATHAVRLT